MNYGTFIPLALAYEDIFEAALAVEGNWDYSRVSGQNGKVRIYSKQPTILHVHIYSATAGDTVTMYHVNDEFPDVVWTVPKTGEYEGWFDITPYMQKSRASGDIRLHWSGLSSGQPALYFPAFTAVDGISPHALPVKRSDLSWRDDDGGDGGLAYGQSQYGSIPTIAYKDDEVEVLAPFEPEADDYDTGLDDIVDIFNYYQQCAGDGADYDWYVQKIGTMGAHYKEGRGVSTFRVGDLGAYALYGVTWWWEDGEPAPTMITTQHCNGQYIRVLPKPENGVLMRWKSRCGNLIMSTWEKVETGEEISETVELATVGSSYNDKKGVRTTMKIRKRGLTAEDVYYYSSIAVSDYVQFQLQSSQPLENCRVLTKTTQADVAGDGELYVLDIELEIFNHGAY